MWSAARCLPSCHLVLPGAGEQRDQQQLHLSPGAESGPGSVNILPLLLNTFLTMNCVILDTTAAVATKTAMSTVGNDIRCSVPAANTEHDTQLSALSSLSGI